MDNSMILKASFIDRTISKFLLKVLQDRESIHESIRLAGFFFRTEQKIVWRRLMKEICE